MERESNDSLGTRADKCRVSLSEPSLSAGERQVINHSLWKLMRSKTFHIMPCDLTTEHAFENLNP